MAKAAASSAPLTRQRASQPTAVEMPWRTSWCAAMDVHSATNDGLADQDLDRDGAERRGFIAVAQNLRLELHGYTTGARGSA